MEKLFCDLVERELSFPMTPKLYYQHLEIPRYAHFIKKGRFLVFFGSKKSKINSFSVFFFLKKFYDGGYRMSPRAT
jgi:hypothetical protein